MLLKQRYLEGINVYSDNNNNGIKVYRCARDVSSGKYYRVTIDFIYDPHDHDTLSAQNAYFIIGMMGALESQKSYDSIEDLIADYEREYFDN